MPSKKLKGKICVYCGLAPASTTDHVLSRKIFHSSNETDPPLAPACRTCNNRKSELENYAGTVLLFGSHHPDAVKHLSTIGERRLAKNQKLKKALRDGMAKAWRWDSALGYFKSTLSMPLDQQKLVELAEFIGKGLLWHFAGTFLNEEDGAVAMWLSGDGDRAFNNFFQLNDAIPVSLVLKSKMFSATGVLYSGTPKASVWKFDLFGGLALADDTTVPAPEASVVGVITGPARFFSAALVTLRKQPQ